MIKNNIHALVFPIEVTRAVIFRDGGTVGIALKDAVGAEEEFCLDGSIRRHTRDRFYWGTFYPKENSGQLVVRGSAAEESIVALLKRIVGQWYPEAEQKTLTGAYGRRTLSSEKERKTALCLDVIERVKQALE